MRERYAPPKYWSDDDERLADFEACAGEFDHEPDFPRAVALYREAIAQAKFSTDPPHDPPDDFQPGERHYVRVSHWRDRFQAVRGARNWLGEMLFRVAMGTPPVGEAEFAELSAWFAVNDDRLYLLSQPSDLLTIDNKKQTTCSNVRYGLRHGPRADGSGQVAEEIRLLRKRYGQAQEAT